MQPCHGGMCLGFCGDSLPFFLPALQYIMLRDVNDTLEDAARMLQLTQGMRCKINLIGGRMWWQF